MSATGSTAWAPPAGTRGLIFDCDGTLADTMPVHFLAWTAMLTEHGIAFPESTFYAMGGMPSDRIIRQLAHEQDVVVHDVAAMVDDKESRFLEMIDRVRPIVPVVNVAKSNRGVLPMAVASGGEQRIVRRTLTIIGALDWFDTVVGAEDTERHKPEPDVFLEAARRIGVEPNACVVFEDTEMGLEAGRRAGMYTVDVRAWYLPAVRETDVGRTS
jgi:beta-phosphoglucomutase family hydrolase